LLQSITAHSIISIPERIVSGDNDDRVATGRSSKMPTQMGADPDL